MMNEVVLRFNFPLLPLNVPCHSLNAAFCMLDWTQTEKQVSGKAGAKTLLSILIFAKLKLI